MKFMNNQINQKEYKFLLSNGFNIFIKFFFHEDAKNTMLIIPDIGESIENYENIIPIFYNNQFSIIILDLPGHGKSEGKRGAFFEEKIYSEILIKIFNNFTFKNGIHLFLSGISTPFFINILYENIDRLWIRSLFISGYDFSINYKFLISSIIKNFSFNGFMYNLYSYIKDKAKNAVYFKKIISYPDTIRKIELKLLIRFIHNNKAALANYTNKPIPAFIAIGNKQMMFVKEIEKLKINNFGKKFPIKYYKFDGGHGIHINDIDEIENCTKNYLNFVSIC